MYCANFDQNYECSNVVVFLGGGGGWRLFKQILAEEYDLSFSFNKVFPSKYLILK